MDDGPSGGPGNVAAAALAVHPFVAAAVLTFIVAMPPCKPSSVTELGEGVQLAPAGAPVQPRLTVPVKPPRGRTGILRFPELPAFSVREFALGVNEKSTTVSTTYCVLPVPLWVIESRAGWFPAVCGENVTSIEQDAPAAMAEPVHVSLSLNADDVTGNPMVEIVRGLAPVFFKATVCMPPVVP